MRRNLSLVLVSAFLIISILHLLVYAVGYRLHRQAANEAPQLMVNHLAVLAGAGLSPGQLNNDATQAISLTRNVYWMVCDPSGKVLTTNMHLDDTGPKPLLKLPVGLMQQTRKHHRHAITWSPDGNRYALVLRHLPDSPYFYGAAAPLQSTESVLFKLWEVVLLSWIGCSISLAFAGALLFRRFGTVSVQTRNVLAA